MKRRIIRVVDYFSGLHCWTADFLKLDPALYDVRVFSIDNNPKYSHNTTRIGDFLKLEIEEVVAYLGGWPDIVYASPPCTTFSVASIGAHWAGGSRAYEPKTEACKVGLKLLEKTVDHIIEYWIQNSELLFYIENPRGVMRKMKVLDNFNRATIWYCRYGITAGILRAKPTDIWHNSGTWQPKPVCKNHTFEDGVQTSTHCAHVAARRGAKTGTQGLNNNAERSLIPAELCRAIFEANLKELEGLQND